MSEAEAETPDEVTRAIQLAKKFLLHAFQGEKIENLGLEEVRKEHNGHWDVTFGFNRSWDHPPGNTFLQMATQASRIRRTYKKVKVDLNRSEGLAIFNHNND